MTPATRFAPSPTGRLHLGHAWSAACAERRARALGGQFLLRIDDIDEGRLRAEFRAGIDADLAWLGLVPDQPPLIQSARIDRYAAALDALRAAGLAYPCFCTRADIAAEIAASSAAPQGSDSGGAIYPGRCRGSDPQRSAERIAAGAAHAWRLDVAAAIRRHPALHWTDDIAGVTSANPAMFGDIVLARRDAPTSYHLASTIDDAAMAISHVVRGADLFHATHIHRLLQALLGLPTPIYHHHRLIGDADGRRLAKRHDAAALATLRQSGVDPAALIDALFAGRLPLGYCWIDA